MVNGEKTPTRAGGTEISADSLRELDRELLKLGTSTDARQATQQFLGPKGNFAIVLDATGSMAGLIEDAKRSIGEILNRVVQRASRRVQIQFFVYRDYDVPRDVLEKSQLTDNSQTLIRWLATVRAFGGGSNLGEAVNEALDAIMREGVFDAVILAGDEPALSRQQLDGVGKGQCRSAQELADQFGKLDVPIHTFVVGSVAETVRDFAAIAQKSGGQSGRLDGTDEMIDMAVMALLARLKGAASVTAYMKDRHLTGNAQRFGALLLAPPKK